MTTRYYVKAETECQACGGDGRERHPLWNEYELACLDAGHHDPPIREPNRDAWFAARGYTELPPETVECSHCLGQGFFSHRVELSKALAQFGI